VIHRGVGLIFIVAWCYKCILKKRKKNHDSNIIKKKLKRNMIDKPQKSIRKGKSEKKTNE
jgi:hypothetical protein